VAVVTEAGVAMAGVEAPAVIATKIMIVVAEAVAAAEIGDEWRSRELERNNTMRKLHLERSAFGAGVTKRMEKDFPGSFVSAFGVARLMDFRWETLSLQC